MKKIILFSCKDYNFYNFRSEFILKLKSLGYDVLLVSPYGEKIDYFTEKGIRFTNIDINRRGMNVVEELRLLRDIKKILIVEKPDLVLTYNGKTSYYPSYLCKRLHIPCIVNNAGVMKGNPLLITIVELLYKISENRANCIMYQNSYERDYTQALLKNRTHYRLLPGSGVDLEKYPYTEYPYNNGKIIIDYVARIVRFKGIEEYLACAKYIKEKYPFTEFRIFGDYDDEQYRPIIDELQEKGIVNYYGVVKDMYSRVAESNLCIHVSEYEGMTNTILEHSSVGRPCIGSAVPGVMDGITDGVTGYVCNVNDVQSLIEKVEQFLELSFEQKEKMGKAARKKMEREFDRNIVTKIYLEEIASILGD